MHAHAVSAKEVQSAARYCETTDIHGRIFLIGWSLRLDSVWLVGSDGMVIDRAQTAWDGDTRPARRMHIKLDDVQLWLAVTAHSVV